MHSTLSCAFHIQNVIGNSPFSPLSFLNTRRKDRGFGQKEIGWVSYLSPHYRFLILSFHGLLRAGPSNYF